MSENGLVVSEIGFDLRLVAEGMGRRLSSGEGAGLLRSAFGLGITLYQTAGSYGAGAGDDLLVRALRDQREGIVIASKVDADPGVHVASAMNQAPSRRSVAAESIRRSAEQALRSLRTDRIDLLQVQSLQAAQVEDEAIWETLAALRREGKILHAGVALGPGLGWVYEGADAIQRRGIACVEHLYNLLDFAPGREIHRAAYGRFSHPESRVEELPPFEHGLMNREPAVATRFLVRGTHASGLLEEIYNEDTVVDADDPRASPSWLANGLKKISRLRFLTGRETGRTLSQAALLWLLAEPTVAACLPNISGIEQLKSHAEAPERNPLTREELRHVLELQADNFGVDEVQGAHNGTMTRAPSAE